VSTYTGNILFRSPVVKAFDRMRNGESESLYYQLVGFCHEGDIHLALGKFQKWNRAGIGVIAWDNSWTVIPIQADLAECLVALLESR